MAYFTHEQLVDATFPVARDILAGEPTSLTTLPGGASVRRYHRVAAGDRTLLVMELGDNPISEEASKGGAPAELPFLNVQRYLAKAGVAVPEVHGFDQPRGLVYLEDLGDITFESRVKGASDDVIRLYYKKAIEQLVTLQRYATANPDPQCIAFSRGFDYDLLKWELDHFREYGLEAQGITPAPSERDELERVFREIADELVSLPRLFVHRDYQSRNLMVQDPGPRLRVIDFQDALLGSAAYDLVGLLRDSYVVLPPPILDELVEFHARAAGHRVDEFAALFDLQTVQRKLKDAGRFVFIDRVKKNPSFLVHIPSSLSYVARALGRLPRLASLREILARYFSEFR